MSHAITQNILGLFASPYICKELQQLGVTADAVYKYRKYPNDQAYHLITYTADPLGIIYGNPIQVTEQGVHVSYTDIPAYNIYELLSALPGAFINHLNSMYEIAMGTDWALEPVKDSRLPDGLAKMVFTAIRQRLITAEAINKLILKHS